MTNNYSYHLTFDFGLSSQMRANILPSRNSAVDNYESYSSSDKQYTTPIQLRLNQNINAYQKTEFFLTSNKGEFLKATKNNFLKIFYNDKEPIEKFLRSNKINFNKQDGLVKLFNFCTHTQV